MFVNFPNPKELAQKLTSSQKERLSQFDANIREAGESAMLSEWELERALRFFQHLTIMELANALDGASVQIERQHTQVLPVDLRKTAQDLREWATKIESGERP